MATKTDTAENSVAKEDGEMKLICKSLSNMCKNITEIDVSGRNISQIDGDLPVNLNNLNMANNLLRKIPDTILKLNKLLQLNLSNNRIEYFDNTPAFCHTIRKLNLEKNRLQKPPLWVWNCNPKSLEDLDISNNFDIFINLTQVDKDRLLKCIVPVTTVTMYNCRICKCTELLATFKKAKELIIGCSVMYSTDKDYIEEIPCKGLTECSELQRLNLCNIKMYDINSSVGNFKMLLEIDFSFNKIYCLPKEFCDLLHLEICILSNNNLQYLPAQFINLINLHSLHLDCNQLYELPDGLLSLPKLKYLDVYDNNLDCISEKYTNIDELDFAQNDLNEPEDPLYLSKKLELRMGTYLQYRLDGRKPVQLPDVMSEVEEDFFRIILSVSPVDDSHESTASSDDSDNSADSHSELSEDSSSWDSSEESVSKLSVQPVWLTYVKKKLSEGSFCAMDMHAEPIFPDDILKIVPK